MSDQRLLTAASAHRIRRLADTGHSSKEICNGVLDLCEHIDAQSEIIAAALKEAEGMEHEESCEFVNGFIHVEPCPFWTKSYCLVDDKCIHGLMMGEPCAQCAESSGIKTQLLFGAERCHPKPCNCIRARLIAILRGEKP